MDENDTCDSACSQVSFFISLEFWINFTEDCFHAKPEAEEMYRPRLLSQSPGALPLSDESAHLSLFIPCSLVAENYRRYYHKEKIRTHLPLGKTRFGLYWHVCCVHFRCRTFPKLESSLLRFSRTKPISS